MKQISLFFILFAISLDGFAAERKLNCHYLGGDELSPDGSDRLSRKIQLILSEKNATLSGKIWGLEQEDSGRRVEEENSRSIFEGFPLVRDENVDCRLIVERALLERGAGKLSVHLKGDGKNSVDLRFDFQCP